MTTTFQGTFKAHPKGFGFLTADSGESIFIPPKLARKAFSLDILEVTATEDETTNRWAADNIKIVVETYRRLAGTIAKMDDGNFQFIPEISILQPLPLYAQEDNLRDVEDGDKVVVDLLQTPNGWATLVDVNLKRNTLNTASELSIHQYKIPTQSSAVAVMEQDDTANRVDLTGLNFVTIDSASTRDIDDAIYATKLDNNLYKLYVAIADASLFIKEGSNADLEALHKGTTVYFQQNVYPMLPHSISSEAGSLWPNQNKPTLVCEMNISSKGEIMSTSLYEATIRSCAKLTYEEVTDCIEKETPHPQQKEIQAIYELYSRLLNHRLDRGATPIRSGDFRFELDEQGLPIASEWRQWQLSNGMVEECMLAANTAVAHWLQDNNLPGIYRHHKGPDLAEWASQKPFLEALGLTVSDIPTLKDIQKLVKSSEDMGEAYGVENAIRATMRPAIYTAASASHYSLAYDAYLHFTSPLRRYSDLTIHRIIKNHLHGKPNYSEEQLQSIAEECTAKDLRAKRATRDEMKRLKVEYAKRMTGQEIDWQISGGNHVGWFLKAVGMPLDTFVPLTDKKWVWNPVYQRAEHPDLGIKKQGDVVKATIQNINDTKLKINCALTDPTLAPPAPAEMVYAP